MKNKQTPKVPATRDSIILRIMLDATDSHKKYETDSAYRSKVKEALTEALATYGLELL